MTSLGNERRPANVPPPRAAGGGGRNCLSPNAGVSSSALKRSRARNGMEINYTRRSIGTEIWIPDIIWGRHRRVCFPSHDEPVIRSGLHFTSRPQWIIITKESGCLVYGADACLFNPPWGNGQSVWLNGSASKALPNASSVSLPLCCQPVSSAPPDVSKTS